MSSPHWAHLAGDRSGVFSSAGGGQSSCLAHDGSQLTATGKALRRAHKSSWKRSAGALGIGSGARVAWRYFGRTRIGGCTGNEIWAGTHRVALHVFTIAQRWGHGGATVKMTPDTRCKLAAPALLPRILVQRRRENHGFEAVQIKTKGLKGSAAALGIWPETSDVSAHIGSPLPAVGRRCLSHPFYLRKHEGYGQRPDEPPIRSARIGLSSPWFEP